MRMNCSIRNVGDYSMVLFMLSIQTQQLMYLERTGRRTPNGQPMRKENNVGFNLQLMTRLFHQAVTFSAALLFGTLKES